MTASTFPGNWTLEQYSREYHIIVIVRTIKAMEDQAIFRDEALGLEGFE